MGEVLKSFVSASIEHGISARNMSDDPDNDEKERQRAELTKNAVELAAMAVEFDQKGEHAPAILYYRVS